MTTIPIRAAILAAALLLSGSIGASSAAAGAGVSSAVTLQAPYQEALPAYCGLAADRLTGHFSLDPASCSPGWTIFEDSSYMGSAHGQRALRTIRATLHVDRFHVPMPLDPYFYTVLAAASGSHRHRHFWCDTTGLLTQAERASWTPVTVIDRDVTAECTFSSGWSATWAWAGLAMRHSIQNRIELDARLTSIVVG